MTRNFAVIGTPINHSLSPLIHNAVFANYNQNARMEAIDPKTPQALEQLLGQWLQEESYEGLAVTAPYKSLISSLGVARSPAVEALQVANTLTLKHEQGDAYWQIDNTDVDGFIQAIRGLLSPLAYRTFVVFGTGATARTILFALAREGAATIHVVGRSRQKAQRCIDRISAAPTTDLVATATPPGKRFDCAINATSLGLSANDELVFPLSWFEEYASSVFDVTYRRAATTRLVNSCLARGIAALDGREMLYAQAAHQALLWGVSSSFEQVLSIMRQAGQGARP